MTRLAAAAAAAATASAIGGGFVLAYLVTLKRAVAHSENSLLMRLLGMDVCMWLNKKLVFDIYWLVSLDIHDQARAKCQLLATSNITPRDNLVCFIGSSTFTYWRHLQQDISSPVYNAGFGGSRTEDLFPHLNELVFRFAPSTIVYYCGINDVGAGSTGRAAFEGFERFVSQVHAKLPACTIVYVGMILSPYHLFANNQAEIDSGNALARAFCEREKNDGLQFVDANEESAQLRQRKWYINDGLHLNDAGHRVLAGLILPKL